MNILIFGKCGQLAWELGLQKPKQGYRVVSVDLPDVDITDGQQVESTFACHVPDMVINASAYTNVDGAEADRETAYAVNAQGPAVIAGFCRDRNIPFIHISTDFVFNGRANRPYTEADPVDPLGVYGKSKAEGERLTRQCTEKHIIIRTSWLYSVNGHNFVKTMLRIGRERDIIKVVSDQKGCPTCARDLAEAIWQIVEQIRESINAPWGTYHYCGQGVVSWYEFAEAIFDISEELGIENRPSVKPISTVQFPTTARRPAYSALDCSRIETRFGISTRPWRQSLKKTLTQLHSQKHW